MSPIALVGAKSAAKTPTLTDRIELLRVAKTFKNPGKPFPGIDKSPFGLLGVGLLAGSLLAPALVAALGAGPALVAAGAILPLLALVTWRPISRGARAETSREEHIALLRRNPLFMPLPLTALDRLAESFSRVVRSG